MLRALTVVLLVLCPPAAADVVRAKFATADAYLIVEVLDDALIHIELSAVDVGPPADEPLYVSPMVLKTDYEGPEAASIDGNRIETSTLRVTVDPGNLCVRIEDRRVEVYLTTLCPAELNKPASTSILP